MAIATHRWAGQALTSMPRVKMKVDPVRQLAFQSEPGNPIYGRLLSSTPYGNVHHKYERGIEFIGMDKVPMQDWDFPDEIHPKAAVTVRNLRDAWESLTDHTGRNPDESWRLYLTPGGVRAWNLSDLASPATPFEVDGQYMPAAKYYQQELGSDPLYANYASYSGTWASRLSPKPRRPNDFVAYPLGRIGQGRPSPGNLDLVRRYHDIPIIENRYVNSMSNQFSPDTRQFFERQLADLPTRFSSPIIQRIEQQGLF